MRPRRTVLVILALSAAVLVIDVSPAAAKLEEIQCTTGSATLQFGQGLKDRNALEGRTNGRGPSAASFTAMLSDCFTPGNPGGPTRAGVDHGTLHGTGKVGGSYCERLPKLRLRTTIQWRNAADVVVGTTGVKLAISIAKPDFNSPWTVTFTGTARRGGANLFRGDSVWSALPTVAPNWQISGECFKTELAGLGFQPGTLSALGPPIG